MMSRDRFRALVLVWMVYGGIVGITCTVGGAQIEEVILAATLALITLGATALLAGTSLTLTPDRQGWEKPKRDPTHASERLMDALTDDELDALRDRLTSMERSSTFSPPSDR
jgi:hypothetical protein